MLLKGKKCFVTLFRYGQVSKTVEVTDAAANVVNFTLDSHDLREWSRAYDFSISDNLKNDSYTTAKDVKEILMKLAGYNIYINILLCPPHASLIL